MGPRLISLFLRHGNFCLLPFSDCPRVTEEEQRASPGPLSIPAGEPSSPSLQTEARLKKLPKKSMLNWKMDKLVGNIRQAARTPLPCPASPTAADAPVQTHGAAAQFTSSITPKGP